MLTACFLLLLVVPALSRCDRSYDRNCFYIDHSISRGARVHDSGTRCNICVKNGDARTECKRGPSSYTYSWDIDLESVSLNRNTYVWTDCDDAMLVDRAWMRDNNGKKEWGENQGQAWCLSKDRRDGEGFRGVVGGKTCYETLRFNGANRGVLGWHYVPRATRGRRSLQNSQSPTEAVQACEADPSRDQAECDDIFTDMVDQILTFEADHPEGFVELSSDVLENDSFDAHTAHMQEKITTLRNEVNYVLDDLSGQITYMQEKFEMSSKQVPSDMDDSSVAGEPSPEEAAAEEGGETSSEHAGGRRQLSGISQRLQRLLKH